VVYNTGWLRKTQILQQDYNTIIVKMVVYEKPSKDMLDSIRCPIIQIMGPNCEVFFEFVEDIPPLPSGKYPYTISNVYRA